MDIENLTDETIQFLIKEPKTVTDKKVKVTQKMKHNEKNLIAKSLDGKRTYILFVRQSLLVKNSFTCGLRLQRKNGDIILTRYNGSDHPHSNTIEDEKFNSHCHIHIATERYINSGQKVEKYAEKTTRYENVNGALMCLLADCNVKGYPDDAKRLSLITEV